MQLVVGLTSASMAVFLMPPSRPGSPFALTLTACHPCSRSSVVVAGSRRRPRHSVRLGTTVTPRRLCVPQIVMQVPRSRRSSFSRYTYRSNPLPMRVTASWATRFGCLTKFTFTVSNKYGHPCSIDERDLNCESHNGLQRIRTVGRLDGVVLKRLHVESHL
jgi:hypothetical protein